MVLVVVVVVGRVVAGPFVGFAEHVDVAVHRIAFSSDLDGWPGFVHD